VQRDSEPDWRDQNEPTYELGVTNGEVHRNAAAERVAQDERGRDLKTRHDARDVIGELDDIGVGRFERWPERETGEIDDVDGPSQAAQGPDLRRERAPVGGDSRKDDRVRWCAAAPGRHAEAVSLTRGHTHPHVLKDCNCRALGRSPIRGDEQRLRGG
jgi:hypothetical protein